MSSNTCLLLPNFRSAGDPKTLESVEELVRFCHPHLAWTIGQLTTPTSKQLCLMNLFGHIKFTFVTAVMSAKAQKIDTDRMWKESEKSFDKLPSVMATMMRQRNADFQDAFARLPGCADRFQSILLVEYLNKYGRIGETEANVTSTWKDGMLESIRQSGSGNCLIMSHFLDLRLYRPPSIPRRFSKACPSFGSLPLYQYAVGSHLDVKIHGWQRGATVTAVCSDPAGKRYVLMLCWSCEPLLPFLTGSTLRLLDPYKRLSVGGEMSLRVDSATDVEILALPTPVELTAQKKEGDIHVSRSSSSHGLLLSLSYYHFGLSNFPLSTLLCQLLNNAAVCLKKMADAHALDRDRDNTDAPHHHPPSAEGEKTDVLSFSSRKLWQTRLAAAAWIISATPETREKSQRLFTALSWEELSSLFGSGGGGGGHENFFAATISECPHLCLDPTQKQQIAAATAVSCTPTSTSTNTSVADELKRQGNARFAQGDYLGAAQVYVWACSSGEFSLVGRVLSNCALAAQKLGLYKQAFAYACAAPLFCPELHQKNEIRAVTCAAYLGAPRSLFHLEKRIAAAAAVAASSSSSSTTPSTIGSGLDTTELQQVIKFVTDTKAGTISTDDFYVNITQKVGAALGTMPTYISPKIRLMNSPGKGRGVFATEYIKRGEWVMLEAPLTAEPLPSPDVADTPHRVASGFMLHGPTQLLQPTTYASTRMLANMAGLYPHFTISQLDYLSNGTGNPKKKWRRRGTSGHRYYGSDDDNPPHGPGFPLPGAAQRVDLYATDYSTQSRNPSLYVPSAAATPTQSQLQNNAQVVKQNEDDDEEEDQQVLFDLQHTTEVVVQNSFGCQERSCLFMNVSLFNHDHCPSVMKLPLPLPPPPSSQVIKTHHDKNEITAAAAGGGGAAPTGYLLVAGRNVQAGEELTIRYFNIGEEKEKSDNTQASSITIGSPPSLSSDDNNNTNKKKLQENPWGIPISNHYLRINSLLNAIHSFDDAIARPSRHMVVEQTKKILNLVALLYRRRDRLERSDPVDDKEEEEGGDLNLRKTALVEALPRLINLLMLWNLYPDVPVTSGVGVGVGGGGGGGNSGGSCGAAAAAVTSVKGGGNTSSTADDTTEQLVMEAIRDAVDAVRQVGCLSERVLWNLKSVPPKTDVAYWQQLKSAEMQDLLCQAQDVADEIRPSRM